MFIEALQISQKLAEDNPEVYMYNIALIQNSLGSVNAKLQKLEQAEQYYIEALRIFKLFASKDPESYSFNVADVQNNLGDLFLISGNLEKAELYLNKAFKRDPGNINVIYNLACLEALRNNQAKALELLTKVIALDENYIKKAVEDKKLRNIRNLEEFKALIGK